MCGAFCVCAEPSLLQSKLDSYIEIAKTESKRNISEDSANKMASMISDIIKFLEEAYVEEKLKAKNIFMKYNKDKQFPDFKQLKLSDMDMKMMRLIFATYILYKNLDNDIIVEIVKKSPLEFVPILRELHFFFEFCSTPPHTFGNAIKSVKASDGSITIFVPETTVEHVVQPLAIQKLLDKNNGNIYSVSRIVSFIGQNLNEDFGKSSILEFIKNMKRNSADDSREKIYSPRLASMSLSDLTSENKRSLFLQYANKYQTQGNSTEDLNKAKDLAKELIGIKNDLKVPVVSKIEDFCRILQDAETKSEEELKTISDKKEKLRKKRDIENYQETAKFLKATSKIFEAFYEDQDLLVEVIKKDPYSILQISRESIEMLSILTEIIEDPNEISKKISSMQEFATISEDGTNLLSTLLSLAMDGNDIRKIVDNSQFSDKSQNHFLKVR